MLIAYIILGLLVLLLAVTIGWILSYQRLSDTFKALSSDALKNNNQAFTELAGKVLENISSDIKGNMNVQQESIGRLVDPMKDALKRYEDHITLAEKDRQESHGALSTQLQLFNNLQVGLQQETRNLVDALKKPQVRGRWGEITLKRVVEVAGMSQYCDFLEQPSTNTEEGRLRPDLTVKLPGNRTVIVDAKAPLKAYMEAIESQDEKTKEEALRLHARHVREHMRLLSAKAYWSQFNPAPDFVVLFLPGESFFSVALEQDRELIEDGIASRVILATPTTLIALLRTVAYTWQQQQMAENSKKIAEAGSDLFERIYKFIEHLEGVRKSLESATHSFNKAVGSLESRVLPGAKRLKELGAAAADKEVETVRPIDAKPRQISLSKKA
ncbi:MAG: DNA recombination protein RmuC [Candidatus Omnitrophica bacterium]|nr:DNA recombination protein RmuC [Candidatus Omnitrophota bacterium]